MFEGFETRSIDVGDARIHLRVGGDGPPLLLLHGYPQTHVMWRKVAPALAERFTLVLPDLRGYGDSAGPVPDASAAAYAKREMAKDMLKVMSELGFDRFRLAGHDRGGRVSYRLALDASERVERLAALDIIPTLDVWEAFDWLESLKTYHWPFLAQAGGVPERLIGSDPDFYIEHLLSSWAKSRDALGEDGAAAYREAFRRPSVIAATCADYRAGATIDVDIDRADRAAARRIQCPVFVLWGRDYVVGEEGDPSDTWGRWADTVTQQALDCGHFLAEEAPDETAQALLSFFG